MNHNIDQRPSPSPAQLERTQRQLCLEMPRLRRYARYLTRSAESEDLVQDTLLRAMQKLHLWQPGTNLGAWLRKVMLNIYLGQRVRAHSRPLMDDRPIEDHPVQMNGNQESHLALLLLKREVSNLPDDQRQIISMVAVDGVSYVDAAERLDLPIGTVRSRLSRARHSLRERFAAT